MGLTPSGGIMMGTRSGDLDPGLLLYLMRERGFDEVALEDLVDHQSGLAGISGVSGDMRQLHEAAGRNADARLAIDMFAIAVRKEIAAMATVLGGVDLVVFTGGIGEHDWQVRAMICDPLGWLGVALDAGRNRAAARVVSAASSAIEVRVLPSQEDEQIVRHVATLLA
jgi:acetate kinase